MAFDKRSRTCCFTGHRELFESTDVIATKIERAVLKFLDQNVIYYGVGGALGFDMLALETLIRMRDEDKLRDIKIIMVAPFEGYMNSWPAGMQIYNNRLFAKCDKIVYTSDSSSREAYLVRDRHLVDNSLWCISYCNKTTGGTAYTLRYAVKKGLTIENLTDFDLSFLR